MLGALPRCRLGLIALDGAVGTGDLTDDLTNDLVLDEKDVGHLAIESIGLNMGTGLGVYKLRLRRLLGSAITLQGEETANLRLPVTASKGMDVGHDQPANPAARISLCYSRTDLTTNNISS